MSKRWTFEEDVFLHAFFDAIGDQIGPHDLGRPAGSAAKRAAFLKKTGAWKALDDRVAAERAYRFAIGRPNIADLDELEDAA